MKLVDVEKVTSALYELWKADGITNGDYIAFRELLADLPIETEISERATPKKPKSRSSWKYCPCCGESDIVDGEYGTQWDFCPNCGQAIDWN